MRIVRAPSESFKVDCIIYYPRLFPFSFAFYGYFFAGIVPAIGICVNRELRCGIDVRGVFVTGLLIEFNFE